MGDWIKNLQSKTSCSSQPIIDGNIYFTSCESISLLHAAVYTCNPDLICQIIDLKADPLHKNGLTENLRKIHTYLSSKVMNHSKQNRYNTEQTNEINIPCFPKLNESLNQTKSVNTVSYKGVDTFNEDRAFFPEGKRKLLEGSALERSVSSRIKVRKVSHGDTSYYGPQDPSHESRSTISESVPPKLNESLNQTKSVNTVSYKGVDTFNEDRDFIPEGKRKLLEGSALKRSVSSRIKVRKV